MTRFARAKGSKASNEKAPEDSTPWEVMKDQLLQAKKENDEGKKRLEAEKQRVENYQNFLKEQKTQKKKATWCDFPETDSAHRNSQPSKKKKKKEVSLAEVDTADNKTDKDVNGGLQAKKMKKKNKNKALTEPETFQNSNGDKVIESKDNIKKKAKKFKQKKQIENVQLGENGSEHPATDSTADKNVQTNNNNKAQKKKKPKNLVDGKPVRRKDINDHSFQLIINSKEVELVRFDGFPIMKKDAERLQDLKNSMIKKGIPKSEVQRTMKLERRRAEKALARLKREVCYNCRKGGHNLSDCPDLKSKIPGVDAADGVCFKCGSTEHKQYECKVQKDTDFKFATCFICREPGHIARQCPDNPKGLYPNGGSCKLCGDVTHLRKDCPTATDKKEGTSIKLHTLDDDDNIEGIAQQAPPFMSEGVKKKPKKIKF